MEAVRAQSPEQPVWKCLREYYSVCTEPLVNDLANALFKKFQQLATTIDTSYGKIVPYDPFPKQDWNKLDEYPVVAIEAFEVIQDELNGVMNDRAKKKK